VIEEMIINVLRKQIDKKYPHIKHPEAVLAKVISAASAGEWYKYSLRILDKKGVINEQFPAIPNVLSKVHVTAGKTVAVVLINGELNPFILGEAG